MKKYKICFWLNIPSNHQAQFLETLNQYEQVDLQVRYFSKPSEDRLKLGWRDEKSLYEYEKHVENLNDALNVTKDWKDRIHIVSGNSFAFNKDLIPLLINNHLKWVHWSERNGVNLAKKFFYFTTLFKLVRPLFLLTKRGYGKLVDKYALGCFAQGELARRDFKSMGIRDSMILDLFYTTKPLAKTKQLPSDLQSFPYQYKFLFCGKLCKRKGVEDLLRAFSKLSHAGSWGLVLVGQDANNGYYQKLVLKLGIGDKVLFAGVVKAEQVNAFYSHCDVFVLPSRFDGWGAVLNEAASIGLPLISSNQTGAAFHLINTDKNGYIVNAGDRKELTTAMQQYILNLDLIKQHGSFSKILYQDFNPRENVERFMSGIEKWINDDK